MPNLHTTPD